MSITDQKRAVRQQMKTRREALPSAAKADYDQWICQRLWDRIEKHRLDTIHVYLPMGSEINIYPLLAKLLGKGLTLVAPRALPKGRFQNLVLQGLGQVEKGIFGTTYPSGEKEYLGVYDLIIVPGLAFDQQGFRVGYGGGYYDNFMVHHPDARKTGIAYPFQMMGRVPRESHDIALDEVLVKLES